ncbi:hypothetical protein DdX_19312 [Ditylenchus destructor]|uniref:Uncharacterized protein n=1 Tax=Ditylenchus destructor TaxID=166010 RepID=A0AAD4QXH9_9BILA|nr:hypothetical protein DdX_19312 [Ditylenchus destructor]
MSVCRAQFSPTKRHLAQLPLLQVRSPGIVLVALIRIRCQYAHTVINVRVEMQKNVQGKSTRGESTRGFAAHHASNPGFSGFSEAISPGNHGSAQRDRYQSSCFVERKRLAYHTPKSDHRCETCPFT